MKNTIATTALILVAGLSAGSSFAARTPSYVGEGPFYAAQSTAASLSRSAVKADYLQARKEGSASAFGEAAVFSEKTAAPSTVTREAVKAEYFEAQKAGTLPANGERG